jgi:hypothetical protein
MNEKQKAALSLLQDKLRKERNIKTTLPQSEHKGFVFTEVGGVTVTIGNKGGIEIPAVRTYRQHPLVAAVMADTLFRKQHERDEDDPARASGFETVTSARGSVLTGGARTKPAVAT